MFLQVCFLNISRATKTRYKPCASLAKRDLQTWRSVGGHHITGLINLGQSLSTTAANRRCYCTAVLHCILGRSCLTVPQLALHKLSNHRYVQKSENPRSVTCWNASTACAGDFGGVARRLQAPGRFGQLDLAFRLALSALLLCFALFALFFFYGSYALPREHGGADPMTRKSSGLVQISRGPESWSCPLTTL